MPCHIRHRRTTSGFSLVELSVVVAIIGVVSVLGLEAAANFVVRTSGTLTKERLAVVDDATARFFKIYGRLPCPAWIVLNPTDPDYGLEHCAYGATPDDNAELNSGGPGGGAYMGAVPFRTLGIPLSYSIDGFENKINYVVTKNLMVAGTTSGKFGYYLAGSLPISGVAGIEVRSGILDTPCTTNCQKVADPAVGTGAAYFIFSNGADRRGAYSAKGVARLLCIPTGSVAANYNTRVDTQNCQRGGTATNPPINATNAFYDNKYNAGLFLTRYFDDYVIWRTRGQL